MSTEKKKVLVMTDWFAPGFKAGGPIRSCVNFAEHLKDDLDIYVLTTDRDLNETTPYKNIEQDKWIETPSGFHVFYASPEWLSFSSIKGMIRKIQPDIVYLNSMFSKYFSLYPLLAKKMNGSNARFILAPRGMLKSTAVQFKKKKKQIFLSSFRFAGLHRNIFFHCTDETELKDVKKYFGDVPAMVLSNLPGHQAQLALPVEKLAGKLKLIFVGRLHPIKNLHLLLEALGSVKSTIDLTIVASMEDRAYWEKCEHFIKNLPPHIKVQWKGELAHHQVEELVKEHHVFVLPTQGENFGHAIFEALAAGRPVIISDQTPWRDLSRHKAGWDLDLGELGKFSTAIERFAGMSREELNEWCMGAWQFAHHYLENSNNKKRYLELFQ